MRTALTTVLLIGVVSLPLASEPSSSELKKQLAAQHFSGVLKGDVTFTTLGTLPCGSNSLEVVFYEWYQSSPPGKAIHAAYRVILMRDTTYLGSYVVADKPRIHGDELRFPYDANGNSIKCGTDGTPPKKILLDGDNITFSK